LIFPFFIGEGIWSVLGIILLFLSIVLFIIRPFDEMEHHYIFQDNANNHTNPNETIRQKKKKFGGIIFIGPIPIVFGHDKKTTLYLLIIGVIIFIVLSLMISLFF
jgi:uncharacterized protein (TIGR00304 family)